MQNACIFALALALALAWQCRGRHLAHIHAQWAGAPPPHPPSIPAGPSRPQLPPIAYAYAYAHAHAHALAVTSTPTVVFALIPAARLRALLGQRAATAAAHTRAWLAGDGCRSPSGSAAGGLHTYPWSHGSCPQRRAGGGGSTRAFSETEPRLECVEALIELFGV